MDEHINTAKENGLSSPEKVNGIVSPTLTNEVSIQKGRSSSTSSQIVISEDISEKTDLLMDTYLNGDSFHHKKCLDGDDEPVVETEIGKIRTLHYSVSETPPAHLLVLFALQVCFDFFLYLSSLYLQFGICAYANFLNSSF